MRHFCCVLRYDHRRINITALYEGGARSLRELEEVIEGYSVADRWFLTELNEEVYFFIGFTKNSKPLEIALVEEKAEDACIRTIGVRTPHVEEIINRFCRHCHSTNHPNN